jgi:hypothetical protein
MQKTMLEKLKEELRTEGVEPVWRDAEPFCSKLCTQNRIGYCALLNGSDPCTHCDVAVAAMGKALQAKGEVVTPEEELAGYRAALLTIANGEQALDEHTEQPENWWPSAAACAKAALLAGERRRAVKAYRVPLHCPGCGAVRETQRVDCQSHRLLCRSCNSCSALFPSTIPVEVPELG